MWRVWPLPVAAPARPGVEATEDLQATELDEVTDIFGRDPVAHVLAGLRRTGAPEGRTGRTER